MDLREIKARLIEHLESISDEQFEEELRLAGIENQKSIVYSEEVIPQYEVSSVKAQWGTTMYGTSPGSITMYNKKEAA